MTPDELIPGYHAVRAVLLDKTTQVNAVWIAKGKKTGRVREIREMAGKRDVPIFIRQVSDLSQCLPDVVHQGFVAFAQNPFQYVDLNQLIRTAHTEKALLIGLDHITDEGNLGAVIRTAVFFGADGLILPKDRSAGMSASVIKASAGAHRHLPVARVVNMARTLGLLKEKGYWIIGASGESSDTIYDFDWNRNVVLVLGNEARGISPSARKKCDQQVAIPAYGKTPSLNVAVAAGAILSEILRQKKT